MVLMQIPKLQKELCAGSPSDITRINIICVENCTLNTINDRYYIDFIIPDYIKESISKDSSFQEILEYKAKRKFQVFHDSQSKQFQITVPSN